MRGPVLVHSPTRHSNDPTDAASLKQIEQDMGNATVAGYIDDFAPLDPLAMDYGFHLELNAVSRGEALESG
jgi:hypothetical protein